MRDAAWFDSRGKGLYRSFLWKLARTVVQTEKAGYDPRTLNISAFLEHSRSEMKTLDIETVMAILTQQKNGFVNFQYLHGMGYVATFNAGEFEWQVIDDRFEDALQRLLDVVQDSKVVME